MTSWSASKEKETGGALHRRSVEAPTGVSPDECVRVRVASCARASHHTVMLTWLDCVTGSDLSSQLLVMQHQCSQARRVETLRRT